MVTLIRSRLLVGSGDPSSSVASDRDSVVLSELCEEILDLCCSKTVAKFGKNACDNMTLIIGEYACLALRCIEIHIAWNISFIRYT